MNYTKLGTALCAGSLLSLSGCGILETVDIPEIRFDSNTYVVQPGDTLESVADRYEVDPVYVTDENGQLVPLPSAPIIDDVKVADVERPEGVETIIKDVRVGESPTQIEVLDSVDSAPVPVPAITAVENTAVEGWNWPARGMITREFNLQEINRQGLDIDAGVGARIQAAADGEVVYSGRDLASYGNLVILRHEDNFLTAYSKVSDIFVKENQKVKAGEVIAAVGTDKTAGTELHFEIRRNGEPVNPVEYLPPL